MNKDQWKAHGMLWGSALIAGFNFNVSKLAMPEFISPSAIVVLRGIAAILTFFILHHFFIKEKIESRNDYLRLFLCSLFGIVLNQLCFYEGLNRTSPINASLMMTSSPIMVLIISFVMGKEKITWLKVLGIATGAVGAILLLLQSGRGKVSAVVWGDVLVIINAISWAFFLVLVKPLAAKYHALTLMKWTFLFGFLFVLPYGYSDLASTDWNKFTAQAWWALGFVIVLATLVAYLINSAVLRYVSPSTAGSYLYLQPLLAGIIAVWWQMDTFTLEKALYGCCILGGIFMVSYKKY